jgi:hypothetical protein
MPRCDIDASRKGFEKERVKSVQVTPPTAHVQIRLEISVPTIH